MKIALSLSGGLDSATLLALARSRQHEVTAVNFRYPSKHGLLENRAATAIAEYYQVKLRWFDLERIFAGFHSDLLIGGGPIPEGHYEAESMRRTVVPGRNLIFISILTGLALSEDLDAIWLGIHAGDHYIYPDCRPSFIRSMQQAVDQATEARVHLWASFMHETKAEIVRQGLEFKVPYHLTRTCYTDHEIACGRCGSCQERLEAFRLNGAEDPLPYQSREILSK